MRKQYFYEWLQNRLLTLFRFFILFYDEMVEIFDEIGDAVNSLVSVTITFFSKKNF